MPLDQTAAWAQACTGLKQLWGYDQFRPLQGEVVTSLLMHRDALVMLPTGAGKSICFQLPAYLQPGLTVVVSPLVSLMENQVQELEHRHLSAAMLHSQLARHQRHLTLRQLEQQQLRLLYLSPETLLSSTVWQRLCDPTLKIAALIIDEAHCIVQWGTTFRPVYRRLGAVRPALLNKKPAGTQLAIAAFTATADAATQRDLLQVLQLHRPQVLQRSPYRPNLELRLRIGWTPALRRRQLLAFLQRQGNTSGLIYTRSRRECEVLATWLQSQAHLAQAYHAGLGPQERRLVETTWLRGDLPIVVCTSAFGMGINKPDVRWICHLRPPLTLTEYVQEIGRAGRDQLQAQALMWVSEPTGCLDPQDHQQRRSFQTQLQSQMRLAQRLAPKLPAAGTLQAALEQFPQAEMALSLLQSTQQLAWKDPFHYVISASIQTSTPTLRTDPIQAMARYCCTSQCRWRFILQSFGFTQEAANMACGHCDRCTST